MRKVNSLTKPTASTTLANQFGYEAYQSDKVERKQITRTSHTVVQDTKKSKLVDNIATIVENEVKDGMTISFHHHLREGDFVFNLVMDELIKQGKKNLTLAPSSLTNAMNEKVVEAIKAGTISHITSSGMRGVLGEAVSHGILNDPVILRSHGGRARAIESGKIKIDVAFLGVSTSDALGNANSMYEDSAFGSLGYALIDAQYANCVVLLTDHIKPVPNTPASIKQTQVDYVVKVAAIGDPQKIGSGATRFTKDPKELKIAKLASQAIIASPYFKEGYSFQTGTGGSSLAVTRYLREAMLAQNIHAGFTVGGTTSPIVKLLEEGLVKKVMDVQDFDRGAAESMKNNANQQEIDASWYADEANKGALVSQLDVAILSALEIDTDFNVNVMTGSNGELRGALGGHQDAATAKMTLICAPLTRGRIATVVDQVATIVTPGSSVDVLATEYGLAVNPARTDLIAAFKNARLPLVDVHDLQRKAEKICGKPAPVEYKDRVVALVEYRDGTLIDTVKQLADD